MVSKQLLLKAIAGVASVAALSLSSLSYAGGEYAPAPAPAPTPAPTAEEGKTGFYIGGRAGYADTHWNKALYPEEKLFVNVKHKGFAGGVLIGYAINQLIAFEGNYMYLPEAKFTEKTVPAALFNAKVKNYAFDLSAKLTLSVPAVENVGVYGKVGVGFLNSNVKVFEESVLAGKERIHHVKPTFGAGVYWDVTPNVRLDAGWQRWLGNSDKDSIKYQPHMDTVTVGVSYFIGDGLFNS